tara:strand:+ start:94 stop:357 length:264 start_codon:yes stop_codon:yes gene_type:complete
MVKITTTLSLEHSLVELAKSQQMNISQFVNSLLEVEMGLGNEGDEKKALKALKLLNTKLTSELAIVTKERDKFKKKVEGSSTVRWLE